MAETKEIIEGFDDESTNDVYPKTLLIHNTKGGMVWQVYHVETESEATNLSKGAAKNYFLHRRLVDHTDDEETFPDWRLTQKDIF